VWEAYWLNDVFAFLVMLDSKPQLSALVCSFEFRVYLLTIFMFYKGYLVT